jgi:hypothetical protein
MQCAAVKKKGSFDPCTARPLRGHTLCGRHARMKTPILWIALNNARATGLPRIQACIRGWIVRNRLRLAGPGVLSRKGLVNDEELVTGTEKERQHPMDYFAFEENGKIWWFSFSSLWTWVAQSFESTNPYTKAPLTSDTRKRLRAIWAYKQRHREVQPEESTVYEERIRTRLNTICQVFTDNGFTDIHPATFMGFRKVDYISMFILLGRDIETVFSVHDPFREKSLRLCSRLQAMSRTQPPNIFVLHSVFSLKWLMSFHKDPYVMTFSILSALYRC